MALKKRSKSLSNGRPPVQKGNERMSSKQSRTIIRAHHRLHKELAAAAKTRDKDEVEKLQKAIERNGGLKTYQAASKQGQSKLRGGDSSKVLVEWLEEANIIQSNALLPTEVNGECRARLRLLEIGALSTENEISRFPFIIDVVRIDLKSQGPGIEEQDFMIRPLPSSPSDAFDVISLSLVLNYVPDPVQRGEMLKRLPQFLRSTGGNNAVLPALFLVLPLPCVQNSRYLDESLFLLIMEELGFQVSQRKTTPKLCYYLFHNTKTSSSRNIPKRLIKDGPGMNNFCIILE